MPLISVLDRLNTVVLWVRFHCVSWRSADIWTQNRFTVMVQTRPVIQKVAFYKQTRHDVEA